MVKIIETNLALDESGEIVDHQSRVIEMDSWDSYINEIKNMESVYRHSILGSLHGVTLLKHARIENLLHDDYHLSCDVYNRFNTAKKLAYLIRG